LKLALAGVPSVLPARSVARTSNTCLPRSRFFSFSGGRQLRHFERSSRHSKLDPRSEDLKAMRTVVSSVFFGGASVIRVFGGRRSGRASTAMPHGPFRPVMKVGLTPLPSRLARPMPTLRSSQ
jgi:hypothetical protein